MNNVIILGTGIAGLSALYQARKLGYVAECYSSDSKNNIGGLCSSFIINGFTFDNAVHLSFATEKEVRIIFDKTKHLTHKPLSYNFDRAYWLRHPVQNNLYPLPAHEKVDIINSFVNKIPLKQIHNYEEWLIDQYGLEFAIRYPIKYTKKYWTIDARQMGIDWIGKRMNQVNLKEILRGSFEQIEENYYYTQEMRYPKKGGYESFISPLIHESQKYIHLNHKLALIDPFSKIVNFENGSSVPYNKLISSIPLPELIKSIKNVSNEMLCLADSLFATSVDLISVGFSRVVIDKLWFYIYDEDILAARAYAPHVKSPANAPNGCSSLQFEIYSSIKNKQKYSIQEMIENTIYALQKMNIASRKDILFVEHKHLKYGNVVFDLGMEERRDKILNYVREIGIEPIGRFGLWDYLWSNQAFMSGLRAIDELKTV